MDHKVRGQMDRVTLRDVPFLFAPPSSSSSSVPSSLCPNFLTEETKEVLLQQGIETYFDIIALSSSTSPHASSPFSQYTLQPKASNEWLYFLLVDFELSTTAVGRAVSSDGGRGATRNGSFSPHDVVDLSPQRLDAYFRDRAVYVRAWSPSSHSSTENEVPTWTSVTARVLRLPKSQWRLSTWANLSQVAKFVHGDGSDKTATANNNEDEQVVEEVPAPLHSRRPPLSTSTSDPMMGSSPAPLASQRLHSTAAAGSSDASTTPSSLPRRRGLGSWLVRRLWGGNEEEEEEDAVPALSSAAWNALQEEEALHRSRIQQDEQEEWDRLCETMQHYGDVALFFRSLRDAALSSNHHDARSCGEMMMRYPCFLEALRDPDFEISFALNHHCRPPSLTIEDCAASQRRSTQDLFPTEVHSNDWSYVWRILYERVHHAHFHVDQKQSDTLSDENVFHHQQASTSHNYGRSHMQLQLGKTADLLQPSQSIAGATIVLSTSSLLEQILLQCNPQLVLLHQQESNSSSSSSSSSSIFKYVEMFHQSIRIAKLSVEEDDASTFFFPERYTDNLIYPNSVLRQTDISGCGCLELHFSSLTRKKENGDEAGDDILVNFERFFSLETSSARTVLHRQVKSLARGVSRSAVWTQCGSSRGVSLASTIHLPPPPSVSRSRLAAAEVEEEEEDENANTMTNTRPTVVLAAEAAPSVPPTAPLSSSRVDWARSSSTAATTLPRPPPPPALRVVEVNPTTTPYTARTRRSGFHRDVDVVVGEAEHDEDGHHEIGEARGRGGGSHGIRRSSSSSVRPSTLVTNLDVDPDRLSFFLEGEDVQVFANGQSLTPGVRPPLSPPSGLPPQRPSYVCSLSPSLSHSAVASHGQDRDDDGAPSAPRKRCRSPPSSPPPAVADHTMMMEMRRTQSHPCDFEEDEEEKSFAWERLTYRVDALEETVNDIVLTYQQQQQQQQQFHWNNKRNAQPHGTLLCGRCRTVSSSSSLRPSSSSSFCDVTRRCSSPPTKRAMTIPYPSSTPTVTARRQDDASHPAPSHRTKSASLLKSNNNRLPSSFGSAFREEGMHKTYAKEGG